MATSHFQEESRPHVEVQGKRCDDAAPSGVIECGKQVIRRVESTCSTAPFDDSSSGRRPSFDSSSDGDTQGSDMGKSGGGTSSDTEGIGTSSAEAAEPSMRVVATGRVGRVIVHDPSDEDMCYKLRFQDGLEPDVDWFARTAVGADPTSGSGGTTAAPPLAMVPPTDATAKSGDGTIDKGGVKMTCKFQCPHCCKKFETAEALYHHDKCMDMPSDVGDAFRSDAFGVKLSGNIQCSDCNQKFDTEKALSLHCKFIHDGGSLMNVGYTLSYEFNENKLVTN